MKIQAIIFIIFLCSCFTFGCKSPTETENRNIQPDSTTQNFTFEIYTFGEGNESSWLNDAWIFDENNIWTMGYVGPIGNEPATNILHWNGSEWRRKERQFSSMGLYSIWAMDSSHVYMTSGAILIYMNGKFTEITVDGNFKNYQGVEHLWGSSEKNIWGVGPNGTIVYSNGQKWIKLDYDEQWQFLSITVSKSTGTAYALARNDKNEMIIVKLENLSAEVIYKSSDTFEKYDGWTLTMVNDKEIYVGNGNIWKLNIDTKKTEIIYSSDDLTAITSCCTVNQNDIYFYGTNERSQMLIHFNGKRFTKIKLPLPSGITKAIRAIDNLAIAVGFTSNKASIIKIKRDQ